MTVTLEQLRDWLATQRYDVDEHMGDAYAVGWSHAVTHVIAELPRYWERIARGEYSVGHSPGGSLSSAAGLVGGEPGNTRPNQAGADGNGVEGQTFSPASSASPEGTNGGGAGTSLNQCMGCQAGWPFRENGMHVVVGGYPHESVGCTADRYGVGRIDAGLDELRDASAQRRDPVRLEWEDVE